MMTCNWVVGPYSTPCGWMHLPFQNGTFRSTERRFFDTPTPTTALVLIGFQTDKHGFSYTKHGLY
jgi:hypothetical protein